MELTTQAGASVLRIFLERACMQTVLYCHGCNEKFAVSGGEHGCPQCGQTLAPLAAAPTDDFRDLAARGTYAPGEEPADANDTLLGKHLGTYFIDAFLGKGGMARVYRARHLMLERPCAIKILNPELVQRNREYLNMFLSEARAAAALVHPHVVTIHTIGHDEGLHYIEMEYVVGRSLQKVVEARGALEPWHATSLVVQVCAALAEAHRAGMVHRDLKPANVLLTESGAAKLADFGLAKRVVTSYRTPTGHALEGTPYYMAPELFDGHAADKRTDVYAMGITYFCLLAGRLPFVERSFTDLAIKHALEPVPEVQQFRSEVPEAAAAVIRRCLAKSPQDRYADATELCGELQAVYGTLRSLESLVAEALSGLDVRMTRDDERFIVEVPLAGERSQKVYIESCPGQLIADRLVKVYSICGPASAGYYQRALELNAVVPHGAIAIEHFEGQPYFVMGNTYPRATCDPEEIRQSVLAIARHADAVEHSITAQDQH
jgi:serine/threonine-protein kinase